MMLLLFASSCAVIRNPAGRDYAHKNTIKINGDLYPETIKSSDLKSDIQENSFERKKNFVLVKYKINPSSFDSILLNANLSRILRTLIHQGYLSASGRYVVKDMRDKHRKEIVYIIDAGPIYLLSSISSDWGDKTKNNVFLSFIKRQKQLNIGDPFNYNKIDNSISYLQRALNNSGYARMEKEHILVAVDTGLSLLPKVRPKRFLSSHRTFELRYRLDTNAPSVLYKQYKVGKLFVKNMSNDTTHTYAKEIGHNVYYQDREDRFSPSYIYRQTKNIRSGDIYKINSANRIYDNFLNGRSFNTVVKYNDYPGDSIVNIYYDLLPRNKMGISFHTDLGFNDGARLLASSIQSQLLDLSVVTEFNINNLFKNSAQYGLYLRGGLQFGLSNNFALLAQSLTVSNSLRFPGFWVFGKYLNSTKTQYPSTSWAVDLNYLNRNNFFTLYNVRVSLRYNWQARRINFQFTPFNLEFYYFDRQPFFDLYLFNNISEIQNAYNDSRLLSMIFSINRSWNISPSLVLSVGLNLEETGLYGSIYNALIKNDHTPLFFRHEITALLYKSFGKKQSLAFRFYYGNNLFYQRNQQTPYFRKFSAGGAYSMRGWQYRSLGPGSLAETSKQPNTIFNTIEKIGDLKVETNVEFRFYLFKVFGIQTEGAVFTDMGNIWLKSNDVDVLADSKGVFNIGRLWEDLAVDMGLGFRVKISFLVVRLDWAYRVKDPQADNTFQLDRSLGDGAFQIGIGYPF